MGEATCMLYGASFAPDGTNLALREAMGFAKEADCAPDGEISVLSGWMREWYLVAHSTKQARSRAIAFCEALIAYFESSQLI